MEITKEFVHEKIREYELDAGESFFDGAFRVNPITFLSWCLGRGHITIEQYNDWEVAYSMNKLEAHDENYFIYNAYGDEDAQFAPVVVDDWSEESQEKADLFLGEFISESVTYQARFKEFLIENDLNG